MLSERLIKRCPSARPIGTAIAPNHFLCFDKRSIDGSGKATLVSGAGVKQKTWGVLFRIAENERKNLDIVEGKDSEETMSF